MLLLHSGALVIAAVAISLLVSSLFLVPIAIWRAVRWALVVPVVELEDLSARQALQRSGRPSGSSGSRWRP